MNKKGFTLTELLVVVAILGIIVGLSIPLIRGLGTTMDKKKYNNYADSLLSASKLYNDSYSEDLFGHKEYGCAYIKYEDLVEKNLLKDIQIENISCNSDNTYVRVIKQKDKYGYTNYLSCGKKVNGKTSNVTTSIPEVIPAINEEFCTGVNDNNLIISADETQKGNVFDKKKKKTKLTITSGTGINNNIVIYTKWSVNRNDHNSDGFTRTSFKVKRNQEKELLEGNLISTTSNEILTPDGVSGEYYLIVRVDNLQDLYGSKWKNPDKTDSKYVSFGPFSIDNEAPTIPVITGYKKENSTNITEISGVSGLSTITTDTWYKGWEVTRAIATDNLSNNIIYKYRIIRGEETTTDTNESGIKNNNNEGITIIKVKACDEASNCSEESTYIGKIDRTGPNCGTVNGASTSWTKSNRTISVGCSDDASGCEKSSYDTTYSSTKKTDSVTIKDKVGNTNTCSYNVYVDKTAPSCGTATNSSKSWTRSSRTIKQACSDSHSGCEKSSYDTTYSSTKKTDSVTIKDKVGNTNTCSYNVYVDKTSPSCSCKEGNHGSTGVQLKASCSDSHSGMSSGYKDGYSWYTSDKTFNVEDKVGNSKSITCEVKKIYEHRTRSWTPWSKMNGPYIDVDKCVANKPADTSTKKYECRNDRCLYKKEYLWGAWTSGACQSKSASCESRISDYRLK